MFFLPGAGWRSETPIYMAAGRLFCCFFVTAIAQGRIGHERGRHGGQQKHPRCMPMACAQRRCYQVEKHRSGKRSREAGHENQVTRSRPRELQGTSLSREAGHESQSCEATVTIIRSRSRESGHGHERRSRESGHENQVYPAHVSKASKTTT